MGILKGTGALVDDWLGIEPKGTAPHYRHKSAALQLTRRGAAIERTDQFLHSAYSRIHNNWLEAIASGYSKPSRENWRWKRHPSIANGNTSPEVRLERSIVRACGKNWCNQVPVASGLVDPVADKRAAVDLVHRRGQHAYEFIELKVESDNPLFAAIEILLYGLLFVWSKDHRERLGYDVAAQPLLEAEHVTLCVLAPTGYYARFDLADLAGCLSSSLAAFASSRDLTLEFQFRKFPSIVTAESASRAYQESGPVWA